MRRCRFTDEQILAIVREGESGRKVADVVRAYGITQQAYHRGKSKCSGLELSELQPLRQLEDENRPLKHILAQLTLTTKPSRRWSQEGGRAHGQAGRSRPRAHEVHIPSTRMTSRNDAPITSPFFRGRRSAV